MNQALSLRHPETQPTDDFALECFSHLKFSQPLFEILDWKAHGFPQRTQSGKIVERRAPNKKLRRTHSGAS